MTDDPLLATHTFSIGNKDRAAAVAAALKEHPGVLKVDVRPGGKLKVGYDLRRIRFAGIECALGAEGAAPARGVLAGLRRSWAAFSEDNLVGSVSAEVRPCCNTPPK